MNQLDYLDFDVLFEKSGEEYAVRVLNSPSGQAASRFRLPFSPLEVENLLLRIGRTRRGVRRLESPEMEASRQFGGRLFSAVFNDEVLACMRSSLNESYRQGKGLRLRMRLSDAPELLDLPWEFLFDPTRNQFLVLSVETPLVRYLELPQDVQPLAVTPPLKVLAMISSPMDYMPLDVEREWDKLNDALGDLQARGLVSLTRLETASLVSLQRALRRGQYHIFHFIGHGGFDSQAQDGVLLTEDENGHGRAVSGYDFGTLLHDHRSLRLAVLNACEGARSSLTDPFAGTAQSLVQKGIPAVIAMQFEITDGAAITLAHEFYGALADGYPVDASLAEARKAIFAQGSDVEWATPVLYLRSPNAAIFQIDPSRSTAAPAIEKPAALPKDLQAQVGRLYTQGLSAYWLDEWEQACLSFEAVLKLQPDHAEAATRLETARRNLGLERLYAAAQAAEVINDWDGVIANLEELAASNPAYKDAPLRLEGAKKHKQVAELYGQARQLSQAGEWPAVVKVFAQLSALDPSAPDPEGLLPVAQKEVEAQRKQAELEGLYNQALLELDTGRWENAVALLRQVQALQPGYEQTDRLLNRAEAERDHLVPAPAAQPEEPAHSPQISRTLEAQPGTTVIQPAYASTQVEPPGPALAQPGPASPGSPAARAFSLAARPALPIGLGWFLASLFAFFLAANGISSGLIEQIKAASNYSLEWSQAYIIFFLVITGLLSGVATWIGLKRAQISASRPQVAALLAAWTAAFFLIALPTGQNLFVVLLVTFLAGALGGWATGAILRKNMPGFDRQRLILVILGWGAALGIGILLIVVLLSQSLPNLFSDNSASHLFANLPTVLMFSLIQGLIGFGGGWAMFYFTGANPTGFLPAQRAADAISQSKIAAALTPAARPARTIGLGWFLAALFVEFIARTGTGTRWIDMLVAASNDSLAWDQSRLIITLSMTGLLSGIAVWIGLRRARIDPPRRQAVALAATWTVAFFLTFFFYVIGDYSLRPILLGSLLCGALGGWATSVVLRKNVPGFDQLAFLQNILGWAVALMIGEWLVQVVFFPSIYTRLNDAGAYGFADHIALPFFIGLFHGVMGFIGGWVMFYLLRVKNLGEDRQPAET